MIVEAYHAPAFSSIILAARLLSNQFDILFSNSVKGYPGCFLLKKGTFEIISEYPLQNGLYPIKISKPRGQNQLFRVSTAKMNPIDSWHRKRGHIQGDRLHQLSMISHEIPQFTRKDLLIHQFIRVLPLKRDAHRFLPQLERLLDLLNWFISIFPAQLRTRLKIYGILLLSRITLLLSQTYIF